MILQNIHSPQDVKALSKKQLPILAQEIRKTILEVVGKNGGHLASNLGAVELTIALHRVFDSPHDAIIWDVSHQSYTHKLLTGRYDSFTSIRKKSGISGFTRIAESEHDFFDAGHASTSISSAYGLLSSWDILGKSGKVVAVLGDGALTGGLAFEALSNAGQTNRNLIVILNDNQMSISKNTGAISEYLSKITMTKHYQRFRHFVDVVAKRVPIFSSLLEKIIFRLRRGLKGLLFSNNLFSDLGFDYVGPLDGHNISGMEKVFRQVQHIPRPVVVHVITKKGCGYSPAENDPATFHGIGPFSLSDGKVEKFNALSYTEAFCNALMEIAAKRSNVAAITAAMAKGTGLSLFQHKYPERFFDVGIAEEHAVTFAGGLAAGGLVPVVAIYSTFLQRSIDQIIHDVALQKRHVVFCVDRAGAVPGDGETHQGVFDIALVRPIPNMTILSPATAKDLSLCLNWAVKNERSSLIRYPKASCPIESAAFSGSIEEGRGVLIKAEDIAPSLIPDENQAVPFEKQALRFERQALLVCTGGMYGEVLSAARNLILKGVKADIYTLRFIKPFDSEYFATIAEHYDAVVFAEDGVRIGGVSEYAATLIDKPKKILAFGDEYMPSATREELLELAHISTKDITEAALSLL